MKQKWRPWTYTCWRDDCDFVLRSDSPETDKKLHGKIKYHRERHIVLGARAEALDVMCEGPI